MWTQNGYGKHASNITAKALKTKRFHNIASGSFSKGTTMRVRRRNLYLISVI